MAKVKLDQNTNVDTPTLILQNKNFDTLGCITDFTELTYKENLNSANLVSFKVYKDDNPEKKQIWDLIVDFKILYIPEFDERYEITVLLEESNTISKSITASSLCEVELSGMKLYHMEINTDADIANPEYDENFPTLFYRNPEEYHSYDWSKEKYSHYSNEKKKEVLRKSSLLHRLLEKAENYSIGYVSPTLANIERVFSISDTTIYDELVGEISEEFNCLFLFDSITRRINVYDLYNTCNDCDCGYRGDFSEICPECKGKNFSGQYGEDTTVFLSNENLAQETSVNTNGDSLKNCFYVEAGDDTMNAALASINPNGTQYLYCIPKIMRDDMPSELVAKLESYDALYENCLTTMEFHLDVDSIHGFTGTYDIITEVDAKNTIRSNYNSVVKYVNTLFKDDEKIHFQELPPVLTGYSSTTLAMYEAINLYQFIQTSMMPTKRIDGLDIDNSMQNIIDGFANNYMNSDTSDNNTGWDFKNKIALLDYTNVNQYEVETAIKKLAKMYYSDAYYKLTLLTETYIKADKNTEGKWIGRIILISRTEKDDTGKYISKESENITLTINGNDDLYIQQTIYRKIGDDKNIDDKSITSLKLSESEFVQQLHYYSYDQLQILRNCFYGCLTVISSSQSNDSATANTTIISSYDKYYDLFYYRFQQIDKELNGDKNDPSFLSRSRQLEYIKAFYYANYNPITNQAEFSGFLHELRSEINALLDFKSYIGDNLWKTFCAYRKEDKYSNSNYVSTGLTDSEIIQNAKMLLEAAQKELIKAANPRYTLTSTISNILARKEFAPIIDKFCVGNWIRFSVDDVIYKLRLLSYEVNYDDLTSGTVEFSTVESIYHDYLDVKSIIDSANSMVSSYDGLVQQVNKTKEVNSYVANWVQDGLTATQTKYANDTNQEVVIDQYGILCRKYNDIKDEYEPYQIRIIGNGLYLTSDNWKTIDTGIGRIVYKNIEGNMVETQGIISKKVVGDLICGEELRIYDNNGSVLIDGSGITLDGGSIRWKNPVKQKDVEDLVDTISFTHTLIDNVQNQSDRQFMSWFYDYDPTLENYPANSWITEDLKSEHIDDYFYNGVNKKAYQFKKENVYCWTEISDSNIINSLKSLYRTQSTIDGKQRTFTESTNPIPPYEQGDIWMQGKNGDILTCICTKKMGELFSINDWVNSSKYTDDTELNTFINTTFEKYKTDIQGQVDKKAETYYQEQPPHNEHKNISKNDGFDLWIGDLWYHPLLQKSYVYTCTKNESNHLNVDYIWAEMDVPIELYDKVDGKSTIYVEKPSTYNIGDFWIPEEDWEPEEGWDWASEKDSAIKKFEKNQIYKAIKTSDVFHLSDWTIPRADETLANKAKEAAEAACSDGIITPAEKQDLLIRWENIQKEYYAYNSSYLEIGGKDTDDVFTEYINAYTGLEKYIEKIKLFHESDWNSNITIDPDEFRTAFTQYANSSNTIAHAIQDLTRTKIECVEDTYKSEVKNFKNDVNGYLGIGTTHMNGKYIIAPYMGGGLLYITNNAENDQRSVLIDPLELSENEKIFQITNKEGNAAIYADSDGNAYFNGELTSVSGTIGGWSICEHMLYSTVDNQENGTYSSINLNSNNSSIISYGKDELGKMFVELCSGGIGFYRCDDKGNNPSGRLSLYTTPPGWDSSYADSIIIDAVKSKNIFFRSQSSPLAARFDFVNHKFYVPSLEADTLKTNNITVTDTLEVSSIDTVILKGFYNGNNELTGNRLAMHLSSDRKTGRIGVIGADNIWTDHRISFDIDGNIDIKCKIITGDYEGNMFRLKGNTYSVHVDGTYRSIAGYDSNLAVAFAGNTNLKTQLRGKSLHLRSSSITSESGITTSSDARLKNSFKSLDEFDKVFMDLEPNAFKYNNGTSDRFHFGFKAQNVRDSFINNGYTTKDFGGFVQMETAEDGIENPMGLIYTEFTSWNTHMIQKTRRELQVLKEENEKLKQEIEIIKQAMA
ncbi:MAG: tail fiber domain-containing protein [Lachnospiraceae bacterium]|nr:tail fiber domain-containing protein [Lachnospiraceae bacterium]